MEASAHPVVEAEPREWQRRALWASTRMWCGATAFFFAGFAFAYFYLESLDTNHGWKIGSVHPSGGLGVAIMACFLLSGILMTLGARRPIDTLSTGIVAIILGLLGVALQFVEYSVLGFGPSSGAYASVYFGWTAVYALAALLGIYWMETQVATLWRSRKTPLEGFDPELAQAGVEACATFWAFYVGIGVIMYVVLYLV